MITNVNVIVVFDASHEKILFCKRRKNPYKDLYNLVGGKKEAGEDGLAAAYRELEEETGITKADITLIHLMDFLYYLEDTDLEVYFGYLNRDIEVHGDENELFWISRNENFFDDNIFAGEGNIGHIIKRIRIRERE